MRYRQHMRRPLTQQERSTTETRALSVALCALSYTGLVALALIEGQKQSPFQPAIYYLLTSFLAFLVVMNTQGYKVLQWQSQLSDALFEVGTLSLLLSIGAILVSSTFPEEFVRLLLLVMAFVWAIDHLARIRIESGYYSRLKEKESESSEEVSQAGESAETRHGQEVIRKEGSSKTSGRREEGREEGDALQKAVGGARWVRTGL